MGRRLGHPAQVVDLAGQRRNAANPTDLLLAVALFDRGSAACPVSSTPSQIADHALTNRPRQEFEAGHISSGSHLPEKS